MSPEKTKKKELVPTSNQAESINWSLTKMLWMRNGFIFFAFYSPLPIGWNYQKKGKERI